MLTSLGTIDTVDLCMQLCTVAHQTQKNQTHVDPTTSRLLYAVYSQNMEDDANCIIPIHEARYGTAVKAPENLIEHINQTTCSVLEHAIDPTIHGIVLCGFHQSAIVAYCTSICAQRILACSNIHATKFQDFHCVTFGLPLYYADPSHGITKHTQIIMQDDWYVMTPFTIVIRQVPGLLWIGTEDLVTYVFNKIESIFRPVRSSRTMRDYANAFVLEYEELLTSHCEKVANPPPSPNDEHIVVDVDWVDCGE